MANTYVLIASNTLGSSAASVTFSSIPGTYTDLVLKWSARDGRASNVNGVRLRFNSNTSTLYSDTWLYSSGSGDVSSFADSTAAQMAISENNSANATSNTFANNEIYIPNYAGSNNKSFSTDSVTENNGTNAYASMMASLWSNASAITSLSITTNSGTILQHSTLS